MFSQRAMFTSKSHNEDLHNLYNSSINIRIFRSRRMRWVRHVIFMGRNINIYNVSAVKYRPSGKLAHVRG
jgi:hypothetical protein